MVCNMSPRFERFLASLLVILTLIVLTAILGLTQCSAQNSRECILKSATAELGVREATGKNDGVTVEKYLASAGLGKGFAWCAAFVNWNYQQCGIKGPASPAWSPSWFPLARSNVGEPQPGDVFGIFFPDKGRIAHVGLIYSVEPARFITIEGNTNTAGSREGDGVYKKIRLRKQVYATANWINN